MQRLLLVSVLVTTAMAGTAAAGRAKPAWCDSNLSGHSVRVDDVKSSNVRDAFEAIAQAECNPENVSDKDWPTVDEGYRAYSTRFGLDDQAWADVADWLSVSMYDGPKPKLDGKPSSKLDPIEQFAGIEGNSAGGESTVEPEYFLDSIGPKLSETARAGYIAKCLGTQDPVAWTVCQGDIDVLDTKKAFAELRAATGYKGRDRMQVRLVVDDVKSSLASHAEKVKKLIADPAWAEYFKLAKQQRAEWDARWKAGGELLTLANDMDEALVVPGTAARSCTDRTWSAVKAAVAKIPAKSFTLHRTEDSDSEFARTAGATVTGVLMNTPDGYLAGNAFAICWAIQPHVAGNVRPNNTLGDVIQNAGRYWRGFRGPRTGTEQAIYNSDATPKAGAPRLLMLFRPWFEQNSSGGGQRGVGLVAAVKPTGDKVTFEFEQKKQQKYVSFNCHDTNHVQGIRDNGEIIYESICADSKLVTSMVGPHPTSMPAASAKGVKAGMYLFHGGDFVMAAWPDAKLGAPSIVLGQPVK